MALPTLAKTWNFSVNQGPWGTSGSGDRESHWFNVKELFKNIAPGWSVVGSGGLGAGGGGGMDAVDRWTTGADVQILSTVTTNNSWVVLQNNAIKSGFQLLIQPQTGGGGWQDSSHWAVSPGGLYTGGTQVSVPTATDNIILADTANWANNNGDRSNVHLMMSSDGQSTRLWMNTFGVTRVFYAFEKPVNVVSGWTDPWVAIAVQLAGVTGPTYERLCEVDTYTFAEANATTMKMYLTTEGWNFDVVDSAAGMRMLWGNALDGDSFPMAPIGLASETTGVRGRHGELADMWWGSRTVGDNAHYPDTLPRQFVQIADLILPWDQTAGAINRTTD